MEVKQEPDFTDEGVWISVPPPDVDSTRHRIPAFKTEIPDPHDGPSSIHMPLDYAVNVWASDMEVKREPDSSEAGVYAAAPPDVGSTEHYAPRIKAEAADPWSGPIGTPAPPDYVVDIWVPDIKEECAGWSQAAPVDGSHVTCETGGRRSANGSSGDISEVLTTAKSPVVPAYLPTRQNNVKRHHRREEILSDRDFTKACSQRNNLSTPMDCHTPSCEHYQKIFGAKSVHLRTVPREKPFACEQCEKSLDQGNSLIRHQSIPTGKNSPFSRKRHLKTNAEEPYFACEYCKKTFSHRSTMLVHLRSHTGEKPFTCGDCQKSFSQRGHLLNHLKIHTGEKPFSCEVCNKSFSQRAHLSIHLKTHTGEKLFSCEDCKKSFSQRAHLLIHLKTHTGEKPFTCKVCQKSFSQRVHLSIHLKTHIGKKPFTCEDCKKTFTYKSRMLAHFRTHSAEKPFTCEDCKKSFSQRSHFLRHLRSHTDVRPFDCEICQKAFGERHSLIMHMRIHSGEKPFFCEECKKSFSQKSYLLRHLNTNSHRRKALC